MSCERRLNMQSSWLWWPVKVVVVLREFRHVWVCVRACLGISIQNRVCNRTCVSVRVCTYEHPYKNLFPSECHRTDELLKRLCFFCVNSIVLWTGYLCLTQIAMLFEFPLQGYFATSEVYPCTCQNTQSNNQNTTQLHYHALTHSHSYTITQ